jgi:enamine deaminase RidA (YjgF/YER057c/UK114 family)
MSSDPNFQLLIPETMSKSVGYSQVATVTGGTAVFVAGQVALDKSGTSSVKMIFARRYNKCLKIWL